MISTMSILIPIKTKITASPYFSSEKRSATLANRKYIARSPRMANKLEVNTINGSVVTAKIAGMLSREKMASLNSTMNSASKSGGGEQQTIAADEKTLAVQFIRHPQMAVEPADQRAVTDILFVMAGQGHLDAGEQQKRAEDIQQPLEFADKPTSGEHHDGTQPDGAQNAPGQ